MFLFILIFLIVFIVLIVLIPLKIEIRYLTKDESRINLIDKIIVGQKKDNYAKIYIFGFLPVARIRLKVNKNRKWLEKQGVVKNLINTIFSLLMEIIGVQKVDNALLSKKELKKINDSIYFKELEFSLGYNLQNVILNSYFMALINSIIPLIIASKPKLFNQNKFSYQTYISREIYDFKFHSILKFKLVNTIGIFIKVFIRVRKVAKENGERITSNRRFNDDSYDIT